MDVVLFLHPSGLPSFGEQQYAIGFADQIRRSGYRPRFLTVGGVASQIRRAKYEATVFTSVNMAKAAIEQIDPAIVIACELYGLPRESAEMLRTLDTPIGTLDATTMGIEIASDPFMIRGFTSNLTLPERYFSFRLCPVNDAGADTESTFYGAAFPGIFRVPRSSERYKRLRLDPARKTVLLPIAPWAEYFAQLPDEPFAALNDYHDTLIEKIVNGLQCTGESVQLIVVSRMPSPQRDAGRVSIHAPGLIPFDLYEHLLLSCDLVISDNIIQASISKAIVAGTPHLVIQNMTPSRLPYPSNIFPLRQLFPADREFAKVVEVAEFSDEEDIREKIVSISKHGYCDTPRRVLRERYLGRISALPGFGEGLERAVGPARPPVTERSVTKGGGENLSIVFYIEIWFSFGEREHALALATYFRKAGYRPRFVVDSRIADHIRTAGFEVTVFYLPHMGVQAVREIDPVMIIGCELFNISEESARGLIALGKPMATMDGTSLGVEINTDPFSNPELTRTLILPDRYWSFRPSPVNDPGPDTEDTIYYNPFSGATRTSKSEAIYASIGLDPRRKTVMLPIAMWAVMTTSLFRLDTYHSMLVDRIVSGLEATGRLVDLLIIGLPCPEVPRDQTNVRITFVDGLPYETYDHILRSCDAIVADNIIQTSVSKAFVMGTPHLIVQNMRDSVVPFRCNIFPLKILFPASRQYARCVEVAEFGDADDIREKLIAVLNDGYFDDERRNLRQDFVSRLGRLRDPSSALERIIYESAR